MKKSISVFVILSLALALVPSTIAQTTTVILSPSANNITSNSAEINWATEQPANTNAVYYSTSSSVNQNSPASYSICPGSESVNTINHCIQLSGLSPSTVYYYMPEVSIEGVYSTHVGNSFSTTFQDSGSSGGTVPAAPSGLTAVANGTDITLSWIDNSNNQDAFAEIYRSDNGGTYFFLASVSASMQTHTDTGLAGGIYSYKVKACTSSGCSSFSAVATADTSSSIGTIENTIERAKTIKGKISYSSTGASVSNAKIEVFQSSTGFWYSTQTDSSGNYIVKVSGGSWDVNIYPSSISADWSYDKGPKVVSFNTDNIAEEKTLNFTVSLTNSKITGTILKSNGTPPSTSTTFVSFQGSDGFSYGGTISADGSFLVSVSQGSYSGYIHSSDPSVSGKELGAISVNTGEVKNLGTIILESKTEHISGTVRDSNGNPVSGISVNAWQPNGSGYSNALTNSLGAYDLRVTAGTWEVYAEPGASSGLQNTEPPKRVDVVTGTTFTINFTLVKADAVISGTVLDASGNALTDVYGWVGLSNATSSFGGSIEKGKFSFNAPTGTYQISINLSPDSPYGAGDSKIISLVAGTNNVSVTVFKNTSVIKGYLKDTNGNIITGHEAKVFATKNESTWQGALVNASTGEYKLNVNAGTWHLGYDIDASSGFVSSEHSSTSISVAEGQTVIKDIIVQKAGATIQGIVRDPEGKGIAGVYVAVSKVSFKTAATTEFQDPTVAGAQTDSNGFYKIQVPGGSYYVKTFISHLTGWLAASEQNISLNENDSKTIDFTLRRPTVKIRGTIYRKLEPVPGAFVWAWSKTGGFQETTSDANGKYEIPATPNEEWIVSAIKDVNGELYRSEEVSVFVPDSDISRIIEITHIGTLPSSQTQTTQATDTTNVKITDGTTVTAPANSISTSGNVSISITPDTRAVSQGSIKVVGIPYNLEARDASGKLILNFNSNVTITIAYSDSQLANLGIAESALSLGFWDESVGTWKIKESFVVNKDKKSVTGTTNHFTRFALLTVAPTVDTSNIADGDLIKTADNPDVYIAKYVGNKKFKRLILNPDIFNAYGHLSWGNIKTVTQGQVDAFVLSGLTMEIYPDGVPVNGTVYQVSSEPNSDVGISRWVNMEAFEFETSGYDWDSIFKINEFEASPSFYPAGPPIIFLA